MRRVLVVVFGIFASMVLVTPSAFADSPHFISASAKVNASGDLVAMFKEAGLGTTVSTEAITLTTDGTGPERAEG